MAPAKDPRGRRVRLEPADGGVGHGAQLLAADRRAARRRRRRSDLLAGVHLAHRRPRRPDDARACGGDLDARAAARPRPRQRRRRLDPAELGLAQRVLHRGRAGHPVRDRRAGACASRSAARSKQHAVGERRRPGNPYLLVLSIPTMLWIIVSGALHNFNMYALGAFVSPFLVRFHHMSFVNAGWVAACVYGFSGIVGLTLGGWLADRLYAKRVDGRLIVGTAAIVICTPLMFLGLGRPAGDVLGFALLMGTGRRRDVRVLLDRLLDHPRRRRAVAARHGDGAVLLRDVRARRVDGPGRHRARERLLHVPEGERRRRGRAAAVRRDHDGGAAQPGRRVEGLRPEGARAVPRRRAAHGDVHRADSRGAARGRPVRGVADGEEGRRPAADLDADSARS